MNKLELNDKDISVTKFDFADNVNVHHRNIKNCYAEFIRGKGVLDIQSDHGETNIWITRAEQAREIETQARAIAERFENQQKGEDISNAVTK